MTSKVELFGAALGKAFKETAKKIKEERPPTKMYRTNLRDVPKVEGLPRDERLARPARVERVGPVRRTQDPGLIA